MNKNFIPELAEVITDEKLEAELSRIQDKKRKL